ncbi:Hypothetical protein AA314_08564 [Archangium gephyra]|uniref:Uncharacterized protein n=1 Tax=Archangium gephyra TaxID=48 RepID=A0AAC8QGA0_9BACT|nr:Hypothetical protein AA314_08564 [Archangium gephyra]
METRHRIHHVIPARAHQAPSPRLSSTKWVGCYRVIDPRARNAARSLALLSTTR